MRSLYLGLCLVVLAGCSGDIGEAGDGGPPPPPDVEPKNVPATPEVVPSEGYCTALRPGERLWSVSAEGQAWLIAADNGVSSLRVLDPFAPDSEVIEELELAEVAQLLTKSLSFARLGRSLLMTMSRASESTLDGFGLGFLQGALDFEQTFERAPSTIALRAEARAIFGAALFQAGESRFRLQQLGAYIGRSRDGFERGDACEGRVQGIAVGHEWLTVTRGGQ